MAASTVADPEQAVRIRLGAASTLWLELQNGLAALLLGLVFLWPEPTFGTAIGYRMLAAWAPEAAWGSLYATCGALQIASSLVDAVVARRITAAVLGAAFAVYATAIGIGNPLSAGWPVVGAMALGQALAWWQIRRVP